MSILINITVQKKKNIYIERDLEWADGVYIFYMTELFDMT